MDFFRLFDILAYQQAKYPQKVALGHRNDHGWRVYSTQECILEIQRIAAGFLQLGLKKGDRLAIMSQAGSATWNFIDLAAQQIGVITVPIHAGISTQRVGFILKDAEVKYAFADHYSLYQQLQETQGLHPGLKQIYLFSPERDLPHLDQIKIEPEEKHLATFQTYKGVIHEDDTATIIYTSGTSGMPKGVVLSHKNIVSNIKSIISLLPINCDHITVSMLPLSHIFERMVTYTYLAVGASLYYAQSTATAMDDIREIRPHYMTTVPRLLERMHDRIMEQAMQSKGLKRALILWSLKIGERYGRHRRSDLFYWFKLRLANILVFRRWRWALGGRIQGVVVGAASLQEKLGRLFSAAGIDIREGYGLTETSPVVAFNRFDPGMYEFGTVGLPIPGVEIRIHQPDESGSGEIQVKGPNVMVGYHKRPEETALVKTEDGWFSTGDVGRFVNRRFLQITGRKKDIFKTSSGKYVAPQRVEDLLRQSPFIEQAMILGFQRPFVGALIIPNFDLLEQWCDENDVHWTAPPYMVINQKVEQLYAQLMQTFNEQLDRHEQVRTFILLPEAWSIGREELTPTLKLVRHQIKANNEKAIEEMYQKALNQPLVK